MILVLQHNIVLHMKCNISLLYFSFSEYAVKHTQNSAWNMPHWQEYFLKDSEVSKQGAQGTLVISFRGTILH